MTVRELVRWIAQEVEANPAVAGYHLFDGLCDPICDHISREILLSLPPDPDLEEPFGEPDED